LTAYLNYATIVLSKQYSERTANAVRVNKMKVKMLYASTSFVNHCVVKLDDGSFAKFSMVPFRNVQKTDLQPLVAYQAAGRMKEEAKDYMYRMYGLEK